MPRLIKYIHYGYTLSYDKSKKNALGRRPLHACLFNFFRKIRPLSCGFVLSMLLFGCSQPFEETQIPIAQDETIPPDQNTTKTNPEGDHTLDPNATLPNDYDWGEPGAGFIQSIYDFSPAEGASFGHDKMPDVLLGSPKGEGTSLGSKDVVSLGCGGSITFEFSKPFIGNGPGADFIIFENAFGSDQATFAEPAKVSVSIDGTKWFSFPCAPKKGEWPFPQCAGVNAVMAHPDQSISPYAPKEAGGDAFDLEDVGLPFARFIKIEDLSQELPDAAQWCGGGSAGFDLDAISLIWGYRPTSP